MTMAIALLLQYLGDDPESGEPVLAHAGKHGPFIQIGEGIRASLPKVGPCTMLWIGLHPLRSGVHVALTRGTACRACKPETLTSRRL